MSLLLMRRGAGSLPSSITLAADDATVSVTQGSTVTITLTLSRVRFAGAVTLAVSGLPSGVTGSFSDSTLTGAETSSVLTLTATGGAATVTDDAFTITADAGNGVTSTVNGTCTVVAASDFPAGALVSDDFNNYADTAALQANMTTGANTAKKYQFVQNLSDIALETTVTYNGKKTMRYTQPTGSSSSPQCEVWFNTDYSATYSDLWTRYKVRFSSGFTLTGTGSSGESYKMVFYGMPGAGSRAAFLYVAGGLAPELITKNDTLNGGPLVSDSQPELAGTNWYDFIWNVRRYSDRRIRSRMWRAIDGQTPTLLWDLDGDPSPVNLYPAELMNSFLMGRNFNRTRTQTQYIYWGPWAVYDGTVTSDPFGLGY